MDDLQKRSWAEISLENIRHNYNAIRASLPEGCRFLGVVKADAYGHGAVQVSHLLQDCGADYLAVSCLDEALELRRGGITMPILILGHTPPEYTSVLIENRITQTVSCYAKALEYSTAATALGAVLKIHIKLDTGMSRLGFLCAGEYFDEGVQNVIDACRLPGLEPEGVYTHFAVSDEEGEENEQYTREQFSLFRAVIDAVRDRGGVAFRIRHCANSGAVVNYPEMALDMVRPGIATYGLAPSADAAGVLDLRPIMSLHTSVAQIRDVPAGTDVSYGRTYTTEKPTRMAVLPIGYADGLSRALSGKVSFRIHGKDAPVIGRICMDMCMVDVSGIEGVSVGDTATLFGYDETGALIPCERVSDALGTIPYEVLCFVNKRIPRFYTENGRPSQILQYIV